MKTKNLIIPAAVALVIAAGSEGVLAQVGTESAPAGSGSDPGLMKYGGQNIGVPGTPPPSATMDQVAQTGIYEGLYYFYYGFVPVDFGFVGSTNYGTLNAGQSGTMPMNMVAGAEYIVAAQCEPDDCHSIHLHIYDPSGGLVIEEVAGSDLASVRFQTVQTGDYTIGVTVAACSVNPCHFGVDVYSKATP